MSRSYRKNVFASFVSGGGMKAWRSQENRRLRHNAKQIINTCEDWDNLIIPILNDYDTLWGSPNDGRKKPWSKPYLNQCEVDLEKWIRWSYRWYAHNPEVVERRIREYKEKYIHGSKYCYCYDNKRNSWYWKLKRK